MSCRSMHVLFLTRWRITRWAPATWRRRCVRNGRPYGVAHHPRVPAEDPATARDGRPHHRQRWQVVESHPHPLGWSTMADLIYTSNVSLDGFIEDARGSFDFTDPDDDVFVFITGLERSAGTYLYGRRLYETMAVWETDPGLGAQSEL